MESAIFPSANMYITSSSDHLVSNANLHGAVLVRIPGGASVETFSRMAASMGNVRHDLSCSAGPRTEVYPGIHTANDAPASVRIPVHNEMAQCPDPPAYVLFYCETPSQGGGGTPILSSKLLTNELRLHFPDVLARLREKGVRYKRTYPERLDSASPLGKSWKNAFKTESRDVVERMCASEGTTCVWKEDGSLQTIGPIVFPFLEDDTSFLAAETSLGGLPGKEFVSHDGTDLDPETKDAFLHLGEYACTSSKRTTWNAGDVLVLDNRTTMHGRDPFQPPRRMFVALVGAIHPNPSCTFTIPA